MLQVTQRFCVLAGYLSTMGLYESAYQLSWFTWEALLTTLSALFTMLFGMMFQFDFFLNNIIWDDVPTQFLPWSPLFYGEY
jgi:hypothetical protein